MFQNIPLLVHLLGGHKEANLKAMCSDPETAGNGKWQQPDPEQSRREGLF